MRMCCKVCLVDTETANRAIKDGTLPKVIQSTTEFIKPEATYFTTFNGKRTAFFFFDMKDSSQMPVIAEPFFTQLNADVQFTPTMNSDDLGKGLRAWGDNSKR